MAGGGMQGYLHWIALTDFSAGLYERGGSVLVPPNSLIQCDDCRPSEHGGLIPVARRTVVTPTGLPAASVNFALQGFHTRGLVVPGGLVSVGALAISDAGSGNTTIYSHNGFPAFASRNVHNGVQPYTGITFTDTPGGNPQIAYNISGGPDVGVWAGSVDSTGMAAAIQAYASSDHPQFVVYHQNRLMTIEASGGTGGTPRLRFTDPGNNFTWNPTTNFQDIVSGGQGAGAPWAAVYAPSDLLIGVVGRGVVDVQGDVTSPILRDYSQIYPPNGDANVILPTIVENALAFYVSSRGLFLYAPSGGDPQPISRALNYTNLPGPSYGNGSLGFAHRYIFLPGIGGTGGAAYVFDQWLKAWHRETQFANTQFYAMDPTAENRLNCVGFVGFPPAYDFSTINPIDDPVAGFVPSYTFTIPPQGLAERFSEPREVELLLGASVGVGTVTLTVTAANGVRTVSTAQFGSATTAQMLRILTGALPTPQFTIQVQISMTNTTLNAPAMRSMRIGVIPRYRLGLGVGGTT